MDNPEWYTGSDLSGRVAAGIESVIERMDARTADHVDAKALQKLLSLEEEPNWRSFLQGLIGTIYYDLEEIESARKYLAESVSGYQTYLISFDDVLSVYCQSSYTLRGHPLRRRSLRGRDTVLPPVLALHARGLRRDLHQSHFSRAVSELDQPAKRERGLLGGRGVRSPL